MTLTFDTGIASLQAGEVYALGCALLWAVAVILFRRSGEVLPPVALNHFKGVVGLSLFIATMPFFGLPLFPAGVPVADWLVLLGSGMLGIAIADSLFFASLNRLGAGRSAIVDCLYSPFVALCSAFYLGEPRGPWLFPAIGLMVLAILVGSWRPEAAPTGKAVPGATPPDPGLQARLRAGVGLGVLSMLLMAVGIVAAKPVLDRTDPMWAAAVRLAGGVLFLTVQGLLPRWRRDTIAAFTPGRHWRVAIPAAVLGAYLAMFLWILGMKYTATNVAGVLNQSSTLFVLILATLFLGEPLTWRRVLAIAAGTIGALMAIW